jgi:glutathione synthase/RimK-type ligase-like ATP-grasp enzyme
VTNDPDEARKFCDEHGDVIYKSLSGMRSIVRRMDDEHLARLPLLATGPTQFQAFIPGENVRVHVVGERLFATRVHTGAVDYRYARQDGFELEMEAAGLPPEIEAACLRLSQRLGLLFAGIDLKETPEGDYYCFEVNPSPGFTFYEVNSGQAISTALSDLLHFGVAAAPGTSKEVDAYALNN